MLKDAAEIVKAFLEFFRSLKVVFTVFLCSAIWQFPLVRNLVPVPKASADYANLAARIALLVSSVYLLVGLFVRLYQWVQKWRHSNDRRLRKAVGRASPLEKLVLEAVIHKSQFLIKLDVASPIAMHLQEIGLIQRAKGLSYTTYELSPGLESLCIKESSLLRVPEQKLQAALDQLEQWRNEGLHEGYFLQISEPSDGSWMGS